MSFEDNLRLIQNELKLVGYSEVRGPANIGTLEKEYLVENCKIIASKDQYNILYVEAESNWKGIATNIAKHHRIPCLVITSYKDKYLILSTIKGITTTEPKPRHLIIDRRSKTYSIQDFLKLIKTEVNDDFVSIDEKMQKAFDEFTVHKQAIDEFGDNLEIAIRNTRNIIITASKNNKKYNIESIQFLEMCQKVISSRLKLEDVIELLLQHVMTYRIFALLYDEHELHTTNAIARSLEGLIRLLKINANEINTNYKAIELVAESITDITEKQDFLKQVYETFYTKYNPKNKDSWGIAYTPSEVVDFMVRSTEHLLEMHFKRSLSDDNVTILDPATGTGTFITSILRHLKPDSLETKYGHDIFANDISILAYYIAALNIENVYQEITGKIKEFENICWMDTLTSGTKDFGKISAYLEGQDNVKRISRQQQKNICVVLGNPPYNAVQVSANDANPSEKYPNIDNKITETYVKNSTVGNKDKQYDMYKRFIKWASERIKNNGIVVFVSNNSFLDAKSDDGFRRSVYEEFDYIYTVNLKGNARTSGVERRKQGGNVFRDTIKVGIAVSFFIKTKENHSELRYVEVADCLKSQDKLKWLADNSLSKLPSREIVPDKDAIWLNQTDNDFDRLVPIISKEENSIFGLLSMGLASNRNEWVYDFDERSLENKMKYFIDFYNKIIKKYIDEKPTVNFTSWVDKKIKWTEDLFRHIKRKNKITYSKPNIKDVLYRPFVLKNNYFDEILTHRQRKFPDIFRNMQSNKIIGFTNPKTNVLFQTLGSDKIIDLDCITGTQCIPLYMYDNDNKSSSNITEFGLKLFQTHYKNKKITEEDIFYYTYAIFNDPKYSEKYKYNLQRKFPRIPLAKDFDSWVKIGKKLYDLHVGFENAKLYPLERTDKNTKRIETKLQLVKRNKKCMEKLSCDSEDKSIIIDSQTTLEGVPAEALEYKFSSKCALEWILEFYKETKNMISDKSCDDSKIREQFNTYKFSDHKEHVIDLLKKVTTVSIETIKLRKELEKMKWGPQPKLSFKKDIELSKIKLKKKSKKADTKKTRKSKKVAGLQNTLDNSEQKDYSN